MTRTSVAQRFPRSGRDRSRRLFVALLAIPFVIGVIGAPVAAPGPVQADELSRAQQQQKDLARRIADQKALIARLNNSQAVLASQISETKDELDGITEDLTATRKKVTRMINAIEVVKAEYQALVYQLADLDHQLGNIEAQEIAKKAQLGERKAELANRIRDAYEAERTSMLETFLSGASFTDMLARMSTQLDAAEQDKALAAADRRGPRDAARAPRDRRGDPGADQHAAPGDRGPEAEARPAARRAQEGAGAGSRSSRRPRKAALAAQKRRVQAARRRQEGPPARARRDRGGQAQARRSGSTGSWRGQYNMGNIPSQVQRDAAAGRCRAPCPASSAARPTPCTPPGNGCDHFHNGIDIVAPYGTPVRASGDGQRRVHRLELRRRRRPGLDRDRRPLLEPADLVRAHAAAATRCVRARSVKKGQVIGYEGNTGRSTGAHLHWMVEYNGELREPAAVHLGAIAVRARWRARRTPMPDNRPTRPSSTAGPRRDDRW